MAHHWRLDAGGNHDGAAGDLLGVVFHWPLGLESADMKTITEMTRELGGFAPTTKFLEAFAALVRAEAQAEEREECAKVCETLADDYYDCTGVANAITAAIRARGNT